MLPPAAFNPGKFLKFPLLAGILRSGARGLGVCFKEYIGQVGDLFRGEVRGEGRFFGWSEVEVRRGG